MACKINWTLRAWKTYEANFKYLQEAWARREINNFIELTDKPIAQLARFPKLGDLVTISSKTSGVLTCIKGCYLFTNTNH